jgi:YVTN family beta-propeller protein
MSNISLFRMRGGGITMTARSAVGCLLLVGLAGIAASQYLEATIPCPCDAEDILWNEQSNKVYVATARGDNFVTIIDGATNQVVNQLTGVPEYPLRLALNVQENKVYTSCTESSCLLAIDGVGDTLIRTVRVADGPTAMAYNAAMNKLYVCCTDVDCISVVDASPDTVVKVIQLGSPPVSIVWHPATNRVFCATSWGGDDTVFVIDCATDEIVEAMTAVRDPWRLTVNPASGLVYVVGDRTIWVMSPEGDSVVATIPTTRRAPVAACFSRGLGKLYVEDFNPPAMVTVIDCQSNTVLDSFLLGDGNTLGMTADTIRQKLYCGARYDRDIWLFDMCADTFIKSFWTGMGQSFGQLAWNWTNSRVYATDGTNQVLCVLRDTSMAIEEVSPLFGRQLTRTAGFVRSRLCVVGDGPAELLDMSGRLAARLRCGWNDVSCLAEGVYFLRERARATGTKVIVQR